MCGGPSPRVRGLHREADGFVRTAELDGRVHDRREREAEGVGEPRDGRVDVGDEDADVEEGRVCHQAGLAIGKRSRYTPKRSRTSSASSPKSSR